MTKEIIAFDNPEIKKRKCNHCKNLILLENVDIDNIEVSSMVSSSEKIYKYFKWWLEID